ncbi:permease prefix domain 1-containing protein [Streptomyces sp. CC228A]|uniref:permease prefix domain 1-containing protein n=1 Tax=Streptomyces sp. CC228A TaxID=2898186 RepID=UPI001F412A79|nr:permease prefix domain 1-containing protein [Streptomyces sp. CC228A]
MNTERFAADLSGALHGPARVKAHMVDEVRTGLADTADAYEEAGLTAGQAAAAAVRDFGTPTELAPALQRELTVAQARSTARTAALTVPFAAVCWLHVRLVDGAGHAAVPFLTAHLAAVAVVAALLAAGTLAATGPLARRLPTPHRLPLAVAWVGTAASVAMAVAAVCLAVLAVLATEWAAAAGAAPWPSRPTPSPPAPPAPAASAPGCPPHPDAAAARAACQSVARGSSAGRCPSEAAAAARRSSGTSP